MDLILIRPTVGVDAPSVGDAPGVFRFSKANAARMIASGQAVPVCTDDKEVQLASLCSAAKVLGVALSTTDREVIHAAKEYGAHVVAPSKRK